MQVEKNKMLQILEWALIKNDVETIMKVHYAHEEAVFHISFLPYYALFCQSFFEYSDSHSESVSFSQESSVKISDVRSSLKLFQNSYSRDEKKILAIDTLQDEEFKSRLRISALGNLNIHYNLGIYIDETRHILANTQYDALVFQDRYCTNGAPTRAEALKLGQDLGEIMSLVYNALHKIIPPINPTVHQVRIPLYFKDFNTNKEFNQFPSFQNGKELTLRLLHLLSGINFIRFVVRKMIPQSNPWQLRIKYITVYYTLKSIDKVKAFLKNTQSANISFNFSIDETLLNAGFRSCMMHYGLTNKGNESIREECFSLDRPLFGLVESCFGVNYNELNARLDKAVDDISDDLARLLSFDFSGCERL